MALLCFPGLSHCFRELNESIHLEFIQINITLFSSFTFSLVSFSFFCYVEHILPLIETTCGGLFLFLSNGWIKMAIISFACGYYLPFSSQSLFICYLFSLQMMTNKRQKTPFFPCCLFLSA